MDGAGTCKRLCFHCCCCSTEWLQRDEPTAEDWKGNNPGSKGQVGKEGPGMGLLGTGTQSRNLAGSGHKE